jgi:hypothetical protein
VNNRTLTTHLSTLLLAIITLFMAPRLFLKRNKLKKTKMHNPPISFISYIKELVHNLIIRHPVSIISNGQCG